MGSDETKKTKNKAKKNNIDSRPREESEEHIKMPLLNPDTVKKQDKKKKKDKKRKLQESDHDKPRSEDSKRSKNRSVITDELFASVHFDPRFQRVPKKESKVPIDSRFTKILSDKRFAITSAPIDKRGKPKKEKGENPLLNYYLNQDEKEDREEEEERESKEENKVQVQMSREQEEKEEEAGSVNSDESSSSDVENDYDFDEDDD